MQNSPSTGSPSIFPLLKVYDELSYYIQLEDKGVLFKMTAFADDNVKLTEMISTTPILRWITNNTEPSTSHLYPLNTKMSLWKLILSDLDEVQNFLLTWEKDGNIIRNQRP